MRADARSGQVARRLGRRAARPSTALLGRTEPFHAILGSFLAELGMPTSMEDLGLSREQVDRMIQPALEHPMVTLNNLRPIRTADELRAVMDLAWARPGSAGLQRTTARR